MDIPHWSKIPRNSHLVFATMRSRSVSFFTVKSNLDNIFFTWKFKEQGLSCSTVVEDSPRHPKVEGSSLAAAADTGRKKRKKREWRKDTQHYNIQHNNR